MRIQRIELQCNHELIAVLESRGADDEDAPRWYIWTPSISSATYAGGTFEVVEDPNEVLQLTHCIEGSDFSGYMVFRAREYEDVVVKVVL